MSEQWRTVAEVLAALDRFEAAIPDWRRPAAYGIGWEIDGKFRLARVNVGEHFLPAAVMATVCGHTGGSASYHIDAEILDRAIELLEPAEACTAYTHPNLATWRRLRALLGEDEALVAVFAADLDSDVDDPYVRALLADVTSGRQENEDGTTTLWRPVGPEELKLVEASGWREWPPRLPEQPVFYPVLNEEYAVKIARDWNVPASGVGHVTRFAVDTAYLRRFATRRAGGGNVLELWIPADELEEFNEHIVGEIELVRTFEAVEDEDDAGDDGS